MTKTQVLQKAIGIAINNGWEPDELTMGTPQDKGRYALKLSKPFQLRGFILSHDFARSLFKKESPWFFGEIVPMDAEVDPLVRMGLNKDKWFNAEKTSEEKPLGIFIRIELPAWQYHLQQMVTAPDPLKYLEDNMPEEK